MSIKEAIQWQIVLIRISREINGEREQECSSDENIKNMQTLLNSKDEESRRVMCVDKGELFKSSDNNLDGF